MKTYAEARNEKPFDWNEFLNQEEISYQDWRAALDKAAEWTTCACGNQCDIIPREEDGTPMDLELMILGIDFVDEVSLRNKEGAKAVLASIEKRSAELIAEITQNLAEKYKI